MMTTPGKGYRWVRVGEMIRKGDQFHYCTATSFETRWALCIQSVGSKCELSSNYRRKLPRGKAKAL